ncbi:MAG TPA: transposase [Terriglobales bacterium]|nr:transposase [Terriglobales bacterium]
MPWGLKRLQQSRQTHFITFSCYHRRPLLPTSEAKRTFEKALERIRRNFGLCVYGYVVMPEHVHLLLSEPERGTLADAVKSLKQGVSRRLIGEGEHFWQKRYYDFNVRNYPQFVEKLRYIHRNPVKRGLCARPQDWEWSSFLQWATGGEGRVEIECEWTARRRARAQGRLCAEIELPHSSQHRA